MRQRFLHYAESVQIPGMFVYLTHQFQSPYASTSYPFFGTIWGMRDGEKMILQIFHSCSMECFPRFGSVPCDTGAWRNENLLQTFFYLRSLQVLSCNNFHGPGWKMGSLVTNMESWIACPSIIWRVTISKIRGSAGASLAANASYVSRAFVCSSFIHQVKLAVR